ncbi:MAG: helix-turn-helix domain-containing protein [Ramlibacter sp.]
MPNIAAVLKEEIARVARKEVRAHTEPLKSANAKHRAQIAALKRELDATRRELKALKRPAKAAAAVESNDGKALRFSAERFAGTRSKLGLSAREMAELIGVSQLSVYKWEQGKARPRPAQLAKIAAIRKMGKREVREKLGAQAG